MDHCDEGIDRNKKAKWAVWAGGQLGYGPWAAGLGCLVGAFVFDGVLEWAAKHLGRIAHSEARAMLFNET